MQSRKQKRKAPINPATLQLIKQLVKGFLFFLAVGLLLASVWYVSRLEALTLKEIEVVGMETLNKVEIEAAVQPLLEGTYLGLIPRRFAWFYPEEAVVKAVSDIPKIKTVSLKVEDSKRLAFNVTEYFPDALWCDYANRSQCYFFDETGYGFAQAPNLTGGSLLRFFTLQTNPERGVNPFVGTDYQAAKDFAFKLEASGWFVRTIEIDAVRDAFFSLVDGGEIKITLTEDASQAFSYLDTLRASKEFSHLKPGGFQYLDLRFGTKVFVNEESVAVATSTATTSLSSGGETTPTLESNR